MRQPQRCFAKPSLIVNRRHTYFIRKKIIHHRQTSSIDIANTGYLHWCWTAGHYRQAVILTMTRQIHQNIYPVIMNQLGNFLRTSTMYIPPIISHFLETLGNMILPPRRITINRKIRMITRLQKSRKKVGRRMEAKIRRNISHPNSMSTTPNPYIMRKSHLLGKHSPILSMLLNQGLRTSLPIIANKQPLAKIAGRCHLILYHITNRKSPFSSLFRFSCQ